MARRNADTECRSGGPFRVGPEARRARAGPRILLYYPWPYQMDVSLVGGVGACPHNGEILSNTRKDHQI